MSGITKTRKKHICPSDDIFKENMGNRNEKESLFAVEVNTYDIRIYFLFSFNSYRISFFRICALNRKYHHLLRKLSWLGGMEFPCLYRCPCQVFLVSPDFAYPRLVSGVDVVWNNGHNGNIA